jgi:hypothetical protein
VTHVVPEHTAGDAHDVPQEPQAPLLSTTLVSHPSASMPLQSAKPAEQPVITHPPDAHAVVACGAAPQARPQAPQLAGSELTLAQPLEQQTSPAGQPVVEQVVGAQIPPEHTSPAGQRLPQLPQWLGSLVRWVSQPFASTPSQSAKPDSHRPSPHIAPLQGPCEALGNGEQTTPQPPQLFESVEVLEHTFEQHVSVGGHMPPMQVVTH